jgi:hypothetical protein
VGGHRCGDVGGPTVGPIGPRAACSPRALLRPTHEERGTVRRAIHGGSGRRKIGERDSDSLERTSGW